MRWTLLAANIGRKKVAKNRHLGTIAQLCRPISWHVRHILTIGKKLVKQQYLLQMSSQYGKLQPTNGCDRLASLRHPSEFQRVSRLGFVTAPKSLNGGQPNFAWCLAVSCACTSYIHFRGLLPPDGILPRAKFTLRTNLAFSYTGTVTARHSSSGISQSLWRGTRNEITELSQRRRRHLYSAGRPSR